MKSCSGSCQVCSPEATSRVPTKLLSSLVTLHVHSPHVFWRLYTLQCNTVIVERNKHGILYVSISVVWFQKCVHKKSCLARGYIPKAWRQVKMTFVPAPVKVNYTQAKAYWPISLLSIMQKAMQIWRQEYQGWNIGTCCHICNNLFKPWNSIETAIHHVITHIQEAVENRKLNLSFPRYWWSFW